MGKPDTVRALESQLREHLFLRSLVPHRKQASRQGCTSGYDGLAAANIRRCKGHARGYSRSVCCCKHPLCSDSLTFAAAKMWETGGKFATAMSMFYFMSVHSKVILDNKFVAVCPQQGELDNKNQTENNRKVQRQINVVDDHLCTDE